MEKPTEVLAIKCTLCGDTFHVMGIPYCYSDKDMQKAVRGYAKQEWIEIKVVPLNSYNFSGGAKECCKSGIKMEVEI